MVPAIAVLAANASGKTVIKGAERLRYKESDRIESVVYNLKALGAGRCGGNGRRNDNLRRQKITFGKAKGL